MSAGDVQGKLMSAADAVVRFVKDGSQVALGGFTVNRNAMLLAREIIRQGIRDLHLVVHSHGQALDLLVGAGAVGRLEIAYGGTGRFAPTCPCFKRAAETGSLEIEDYTNFQMSLRFLAGALGLPFIPCRSGLGTDILRREGFSAETRRSPKVAPRKLIETDNPFGAVGDKVLLLPALNPDVALIHAQTVGDDGTVRIKGLTFADVEQARSAGAVVISCEEIVPARRLRQDPNQNMLPPFVVDAVVLAPHGAHPTACHQFYDYDPRHLRRYGEAARSEDGFRDYLMEWVHGPADHEAYLAMVGPDDLAAIAADPRLGYARGLDRR
jgi:glutaconate CoA-transferase subunit A